MITLIIFYAHVVAAVTLFTKHWQEGDWKEGLLAVGSLLLLFSVGWSISTFVLKLFLHDERGFATWLDRDTLSLVLLSAMEGIFFTVQTKIKWLSF